MGGRPNANRRAIGHPPGMIAIEIDDVATIPRTNVRAVIGRRIDGGERVVAIPSTTDLGYAERAVRRGRTYILVVPRWACLVITEPEEPAIASAFVAPGEPWS